MEAENNPDSVQFAFLLVMMTSKCGLYCWMQRTGKQSMKAISVSSVWILHLAHLVSHDILTKAIETRLMFCFCFFVFQNTNYDLIDFLWKRVFYTQSFTLIGKQEKVITIHLRKSYGVGGEQFSFLEGAKDAGEAVFVLDKSHLTAVDSVLTCVGFQAITWCCMYRPAPTG